MFKERAVPRFVYSHTPLLPRARGSVKTPGKVVPNHSSRPVFSKAEKTEPFAMDLSEVSL